MIKQRKMLRCQGDLLCCPRIVKSERTEREYIYRERIQQQQEEEAVEEEEEERNKIKKLMRWVEL